ncbi:unnamed protein product, partial [Ectocarpus sp. 4 AP-2014]
YLRDAIGAGDKQPYRAEQRQGLPFGGQKGRGVLVFHEPATHAQKDNRAPIEEMTSKPRETAHSDG